MRRAIGLLAAVLLAGCAAPNAGAPNADAAAATGATGANATAARAERLIVEGDDATRIVNISTGAVLATLPGGVLSPAGDRIVSVRGAVGTKKTVILGWDLGGNTVLSL